MKDQLLFTQLRSYKKKFFLHELTRGLLTFVGFLLVGYLVTVGLEYLGHFPTWLRAILFFSFLGFVVYTLVRWIAIPAYHLIYLDRNLSDEKAAVMVGKAYPDIADKLLNTVQLYRQADQQQDALLTASLQQKSAFLSRFRFPDAVDMRDNLQLLKYIVPLTLLLGLLYLIIPQLFSEGTTRLVHYKQEFLPQAPFQFQLLNADQTAFRNEDFTVRLQMTGEALPEQVFLMSDNRRYKLEKTSANEYEYTFRNVQRDLNFSFVAAGFSSSSYHVPMIFRPEITSFDAELIYPSYLKRSAETLSNTGNFTIPAGTRVNWVFRAAHVDSLVFQFEGESKAEATQMSPALFSYSRTLLESADYEIQLRNEYSSNRDRLAYRAEVVPDQFPSITLEKQADTTLFSYLGLMGQVTDDYGLTGLYLVYRVLDTQKPDQETKYQRLNIGLRSDQASQNYFYSWALDALKLQPGQALEYYVQVFDNDGINGPKSSKTPVQKFQVPQKEAIQEQLANQAQATEQDIQQILSQTRQLNREWKETRERLASKKNLTYQDQKMMEDLMKRQQELKEQIAQMQEQYQSLQQQKDRFSNESPEVQEKAEQLENLLSELQNDETQKMLEELQRMLQERMDPQELQKMMQQMEKKDRNLENELDRALELYKRLKLDEQIEETIAKVDEMQKEQENLADQEKSQKADPKKNKDSAKEGESKDQKGEQQTGDKDQQNKESQQNDQRAGDQNKQDPPQQGNQNDKQSPEESPKSQEQLSQEQEQLNKEFEQLKEDFEKMNKLNEQLERPKDMSEAESQRQDASQEMQKALQQLKQNQSQKGQQSQKNAAQKMQQLSQQLSEMKMSMAQQQAMENMDDLRMILENLVNLSFDQEQLMKDFRSMRQSDPRFIELAQQQLKLREDARIVEDSLQALAKRVFQIQSFVTREVSAMNDHMDSSIDALRRRRPAESMSNQQYAMTSMNNLALMLSDALKQMQQQMASMMSGQQMIQSQSQPMPGLGEMQQQLNQQMQDLMRSGKDGRVLSEQLAKLALQQEQLRRALQKVAQQNAAQEMQQGEKGMGGQMLKEIQREMEKTEEDLVNKRLSSELLERQKRMTTRLLEAEKAMKEQELDPNRESKTAKSRNPSNSPNFEEYLKLRRQQVEILKSVNPTLSPFYKEETNRYFSNIP
ncbi:hypothetical protein SAMN05421823_103589 [Catalinimonas alkaloidigena]|uniref:ATPase n=1 Tax=Catalinimonas alkaloidigena TaxID=1075417 RepID=A0A1G9EUH1_9BACT|nr:DUF4175 family protein [Catalinimonas alkaloidigena]SDK79789.1 hypothetical protein SAMN05421823_103589 [Catalinimonas alkaloidigena]